MRRLLRAKPTTGPSPRFLQAQSRRQQVRKVNPRQESSERMQIGLSFDALDEGREAQFDPRIAEVLQPGAATRKGAQRFALKRAKLAAGRVTTPGPKTTSGGELLQLLRFRPLF